MDRRVEKKVWTPKRIATISGIAAFVFAVIYMAVFGDHSARLNVQVDRITISEVTRGPFQEFTVQRGTVLPIQTYYIDALEGGQIEEIFLEEGTMVEKGTPLLKLSNPTLEQNILTQEARLFEQINNMENTRLNLENRAIRNRQELMRVELNLRETERQHEKQKVLFERGLTSQDLFESARDRYQNDQKRKVICIGNSTPGLAVSHQPTRCTGHERQEFAAAIGACAPPIGKPDRTRAHCRSIIPIKCRNWSIDEQGKAHWPGRCTRRL